MATRADEPGGDGGGRTLLNERIGGLFECLRRSRRPDRNALEELFKICYNPLMAFLVYGNMRADEHIAADAIQEVFLKLATVPQVIPDKGDLRNAWYWLSASVRNKYLDITKIRKNQRSGPSHTDRVDGSQASPAERMEFAELKELVVDAILGMSPQFRVTAFLYFHLRVDEGDIAAMLSGAGEADLVTPDPPDQKDKRWDEWMAQTLDISTKTVHTRIYRIRGHIRDHLRSHGIPMDTIRHSIERMGMPELGPPAPLRPPAIPRSWPAPEPARAPAARCGRTSPHTELEE